LIAATDADIMTDIADAASDVENDHPSVSNDNNVSQLLIGDSGDDHLVSRGTNLHQKSPPGFFQVRPRAFLHVFELPTWIFDILRTF
jgi:hypothetical protein